MNFRIAILAAGKGTRMNQDIPKALTPVGGKPILQYLIESIEDSGVENNPIVVTGPEGTRFCDSFNKECEYVVQHKQLGTGHAVMQTQEKVGDADALIVLYGDHPFISADSLKRLAERHEERGNTITMMTTTVPHYDEWYCAFSHWGRILRGEDGHIQGIRQWKDASAEEQEIREVDPALFCFKTSWLWENIERLKNNNSQEEYYLTDLISMCVEQGEPISSLEVEPEEAIGINTPTECKVAEEILLMQSKKHG